MSDCITSLPECQGKRAIQETPAGATNCLNLAYTTAFKFVAGTLEVFLDGRRLTNLLDFTEGADFMSFTVLLDPTDKNRLNTAPGQNEDLRVDYTKQPSTNCITIL